MARGLRILDPWRDFGSLQERINRMFDDTIGTLYPHGGEELERGAFFDTCLQKGINRKHR